ncbi:hypothetical protein [Actinocatenispora thailandica]|uniref:hypothetical protein n=1 Tax=Actinocatenispora thailandica TaxID=227318 RepID=UPI00194F40C6|nr:hypothetical protein [Actinocatenispora thailandica]
MAATVPATIAAGPAAADEVTVSADPTNGAQVGQCRYDGCTRLDLAVTADNASDAVTASSTVTVRVTAGEWTVGRCRLPAHVLAPSAHRTWPCPVADPRMAPIGSARAGNWAASYSLGSLTETSHAAALASADRAAARRLGRPGGPRRGSVG